MALVRPLLVNAPRGVHPLDSIHFHSAYEFVPPWFLVSCTPACYKSNDRFLLLLLLLMIGFPAVLGLIATPHLFRFGSGAEATPVWAKRHTSFRPVHCLSLPALLGLIATSEIVCHFSFVFVLIRLALPPICTPLLVFFCIASYLYVLVRRFRLHRLIFVYPRSSYMLANSHTFFW